MDLTIRPQHFAEPLTGTTANAVPRSKEEVPEQDSQDVVILTRRLRVLPETTLSRSITAKTGGLK